MQNYNTSYFMENTIDFSICNKSFKPLSFPRGRVKPNESLPEMLPINIIPIILSIRLKYHKNNDSYSLESFTR
jgi:hypothetical protein